MLIFLLCIAVGTQFILSALTKIRNYSTFLTIFKAYPVLNNLKIDSLAYLVIVSELILGTLLLSLNKDFIRFGLLGSCLFISLANFLVVLRLNKGERRFKCGCGEALDEEQNAVWILTRNFALLLLLGFGFIAHISDVSIFPKDALHLYLSGWGLLAGAKLVTAIFQSIFYIKQWIVDG